MKSGLRLEGAIGRFADGRFCRLFKRSANG